MNDTHAKIDTGGPAFPMPLAVDHGETIYRLDECVPGDRRDLMGMTLRDYFAARLMPEVYRLAMGGNLSVERNVLTHPDPEDWIREACVAYAIADAMLKARQS